MNSRTQPVLSIDIGGTKTAVAVVEKSGTILWSTQFPTLVEEGPPSLIRRVLEHLSAFSDPPGGHDIAGCGISAPGPLSSSNGCFLNPPNMPGWHGFPIKAALEEALKLPCTLMNDANAAALAEFLYGAGQGSDTMVFFTMSTGMGAGLIIQGRLHQGPDDMAGEVGHLAVAPDGPVGFGIRGSLEGFCSGPGIAQLAVTRLIQARHRQEDSALFHLDRDWRLIDSRDVGQAAQAGDALARDCLEECAEKLGSFCALLTDLLNPDRIVLGTIGRIHQDIIIPTARRVVEERAHPAAARRLQIVPSRLGESLPFHAGAAAFFGEQSRNA